MAQDLCKKCWRYETFKKKCMYFWEDKLECSMFLDDQLSEPRYETRVKK